MIIQEITGDKDIITTSLFPRNDTGRDWNPLDDGSYIYDTPGDYSYRHQMAHYLTAEKPKYVSPLKGNQT